MTNAQLHYSFFPFSSSFGQYLQVKSNTHVTLPAKIQHTVLPRQISQIFGK